MKTASFSFIFRKFSGQCIRLSALSKHPDYS
jgi:hypothetical protein